MSGRVELRQVLPGDLQAIYDQQRDPESAMMAAFPPRDRPAFDEHWKRILADDTVVARTIVHDGDIAGHAVSFLLEGSRQVGYWIARDRWGRGIATRALALLLEEIRERPLWAHVARHNAGSIRVLEKCGFVVRGEGRIPPPAGADGAGRDPGDRCAPGDPCDTGDGVEELIMIRER